MIISKEQREIIRSANSVEELIALAKKAEINLTEEEAEKLLGTFKREGELEDDELENVSGGLCEEDNTPQPPADVKYATSHDGSAVCECGSSFVMYKITYGRQIHVDVWCALCRRYIERLNKKSQLYQRYDLEE